MINIMYENENIEGSPFTVRVYDPGRVKVFGLQDSGDKGGPIQFSGEFIHSVTDALTHVITLLQEGMKGANYCDKFFCLCVKNHMVELH